MPFMQSTRRQWRANRRMCVSVARSILCDNRYVIRADNCWLETLLTLDLITDIEDPNVRLGNVVMTADQGATDIHQAASARRALEQSNLRIPVILITSDNATLEDFCQLPFVCYKIVTAVQNMGLLGRYLPQQEKTDMGDFIVADPCTLQVNLASEDLTVIERAGGSNVEFSLPMGKLKLKVWPNDSTCLTITQRKNFGIAKKSTHLDVKFLSVDDQRRFINVFEGVLAHKRQLPPVVRTRDEQFIPLSIWVGTLNLSNNKPPASLDPWLQKEGGYDIVAMGYQGCQEFEDYEWMGHLIENMGPDMVPVGAYEAGAIRSLVAVNKRHLHAVTHVEAERCATGVAHLGFDKGSVGISFLIYRSRVAFVNSHLAAHHERVDRRVSDVKEIIDGGLEFGYHGSSVDFTNRFNTFFFGDLNFRIEADRTDILDLIREEEWEELQELDQLKTLQSETGLLHGFEEGPLEFPPTYKYKVVKNEHNIARKNKQFQQNTREYDDDVSVSTLDARFTGIRRPAWTDRILYKPLPGQLIKCTRYTCDDNIATSSHSPVSAQFVMGVEKPPHYSIQMRRATIVIRSLRLHDLQTTAENPPSRYTAKFRVCFVDDVCEPDFRWQDTYRKKVTLSRADGGYEWEGKCEIGPILCRPQSLRVEHLTCKLRHKRGREGHCSIALRDAVNLRHPQEFGEDITRESYPRGRLDGTLEVLWDGDQNEREDFKTLTSTTKNAMLEAGIHPDMLEGGHLSGADLNDPMAMVGGGGGIGGGGGMGGNMMMGSMMAGSGAMPMMGMGGGSGMMMGGSGEAVSSVLNPTDRNALEVRMDGTLATADGHDAGPVDSTVTALSGIFQENPAAMMGEADPMADLDMLDGLDIPNGAGMGGMAMGSMGGMMMGADDMSMMMQSGFNDLDDLDGLDIP